MLASFMIEPRYTRDDAQGELGVPVIHHLYIVWRMS